MGRILTIPGGGGGISSSDVTAKSADVLVGTKTIMADSNDEVIEGEMVNHGAISKVLKCGESITIPQGYHNGSGEISADSLASQTEGTATASDLYTGKTMVVNGQKITGTMKDLSKNTSIQYASDNSVKVIAGDAVFKQKNTDNVDRICVRYNGENGFITENTLFGIPSSNFGTVSTENVLKGQTFTSSNGIKLSGSMPNNSGLSTNGTVPGISSSYKNIPTREASSLQMNTDTKGTSRISMCPPPGWYPGGGESYVNRPSSDFGTVAASNVRSGQTFTSTAGIKVTGTMSVQSAISFSAAATSYNTIRISWKNPARGPWQGVFIQMSTSGNPGTGGGSRAYTGRGNSSSANASNYVDITGLNANTMYYFTCTSYVDNLGWGTSYNVNAKTKAISPIQAFDLVGLYPGASYGYRRYGDSSAYECSYHQFTNGILICGGEEPYEDGEAYWRKSSLAYGATNDTVSIDLRFSGSVRDDESTVNKLISYLTPALVGKTVRIGGASYNRNSTNVRKMDANLYSTAKIASLGKFNWGTNGKWKPYNLTIRFSNTSYTFGSSFSMDFNV